MTKPPNSTAPSTRPAPNSVCKLLDPLGALWLDCNGDAHINTAILARVFELPETEVITFATQWLRDQGFAPNRIIFTDHREKGI